jgi:hypothetical protein
MPVRSDRVSWFPRRWLAILLLCFPAMPVQAEALVAVAANFANTAR